MNSVHQFEKMGLKKNKHVEIVVLFFFNTEPSLHFWSKLETAAECTCAQYCIKIHEATVVDVGTACTAVFTTENTVFFHQLLCFRRTLT